MSGSLTNVSFTAWEDGHPSDKMFSAFLGIQNAVGLWYSYSSNGKFLPLCEKFAVVTTPTTKAVVTTTTSKTTTYHAQNPNDTECRLPWVQILNGCYLIGWEASSWEAGRSFCLDRGGYLLQVNSEEEQNAVTGNEAVFFSILDKNKKKYGFFR